MVYQLQQLFFSAELASLGHVPTVSDYDTVGYSVNEIKSKEWVAKDPANRRMVPYDLMFI